MSGNSQGPTGFLPGMFKEDGSGGDKHIKEDSKSGKVIFIYKLYLKVLNQIFAEQEEKEGQEET